MRIAESIPLSPPQWRTSIIAGVLIGLLALLAMTLLNGCAQPYQHMGGAYRSETYTAREVYRSPNGGTNIWRVDR